MKGECRDEAWRSKNNEWSKLLFFSPPALASLHRLRLRYFCSSAASDPAFKPVRCPALDLGNYSPAGYAAESILSAVEARATVEAESWKLKGDADGRL